MRRAMWAAAAGLLFAAASGCGGARPSRYYEMELPTMATSATVTPYPISLLVGRINAPHLFRDDRIVYRTSPFELGTYEYHRWVEPPTEMLEAMLVRELRSTGRFRSVGRVGSSSRGDYVVRGRLSRLEEVDENGVAAGVEFELELFQNKTGAVVWSRVYSHDEPVSSKAVPEVVKALNHNIQQGLQEMTAGMEQYFENNPPK
jgi:ABC-type uncharacterized transport system auxiliary subunit